MVVFSSAKSSVEKCDGNSGESESGLSPIPGPSISPLWCRMTPETGRSPDSTQDLFSDQESNTQVGAAEGQG
jgi:hypothetical protein